MFRAGLWAALLLLGSSAASARQGIPVCRAPFGRLLGDAVFRRYPAAPLPASTRLLPPDVRSGQARRYRTLLREDVRGAPDFAGHYALVRIGCGAATVCVAIADRLTGKVFFPPNLRSATALIYDTGKRDVSQLAYRRDSRLLIVAGSPNEDERSAGLSYYLWEAHRLKRIRFVPVRALCGSRSGASWWVGD